MKLHQMELRNQHKFRTHDNSSTVFVKEKVIIRLAFLNITNMVQNNLHLVISTNTCSTWET